MANEQLISELAVAEQFSVELESACAPLKSTNSISKDQASNYAGNSDAYTFIDFATEKSIQCADKLTQFAHKVKRVAETLQQMDEHLRDKILSQTEAQNMEVYTVRRGDNLWEISESTGVDIDTLREINQVDEQGSIHQGQVLKVRKSTDEVIIEQGKNMILPGNPGYTRERD